MGSSKFGGLRYAKAKPALGEGDLLCISDIYESTYIMYIEKITSNFDPCISRNTYLNISECTKI